MGLLVQMFQRGQRSLPSRFAGLPCEVRRKAKKGPGDGMRVWGKKPEKEASARGVAPAAVAGASREELLRAALAALVRAGNADRIGVWLEADSNPGRPAEAVAGFHGMVWDRENEEVPIEWAHLSVEAPLPEEELRRGKSVEQDLDALPERPIIGPDVELRRVLWTPVERKGHLKGLILAGSRNNHLMIPRDAVETIAAELALSLSLLEEQQTARVRTADIKISRYVLKTLSGGGSAESMLTHLVESCTGMLERESGFAAEFAMIGAVNQDADVSERAQAIFQWRSGDSAWTSAAESEPLAGIWRGALHTRRVAGNEPPASGNFGRVARVVTFPLEFEGQLVGILVVGLPQSSISLATLDRLELRAELAAAALWWKKRDDQESRHTEWQQALLDSSGDAAFLLDEVGRIVASSRAARELLDRTSNIQEIRAHGAGAAKRFVDLFRTKEHAPIQTLVRGSSCAGARVEPGMENWLPVELRNGVRVELRTTAPKAGRHVVVLREAQGVREVPRGRDRAEIELQNVLEWLEEGVVLFDARENVRAMNTRFVQIAGLPPEESATLPTLESLIGRLKHQAAQPGQFAARWRELARGIEGGVREELQMTRPSPRILERAARPVLDAAGRPLGRVEVYRDLTAQRIFQSKLLQTEKLAALGQMVSGIAHELSNPLTSILGYAQRLAARQDFSGRTQEVRQILQEAERASAILRQLLLNARETLPERRSVSLNHVVLQAMDLQNFGLAAEKIAVELNLDPDLPAVHGDAGHLQQVLMNLVGNARQAIEQQGRGGIIRLRTRNVGQQRVHLEVEDNGPGIPQAILARIFDPFFTTKPAGVGTGLGLAVVLSVVREHGGRVHVSSSPEGGAIFQVELPAAAERMQEQEAIGSPFPEATPVKQKTKLNRAREKKSVVPGVQQKGSRVLVVEDEPTVARLIADVMEDEGFAVEVLLDGREALEHAARASFDLVICDMKMPGLDGQHFYKSLVRSGNPLRDRFLFVTGDIVAAQTREFLVRNHLPHVAKPFRVEELTEKVRAVLASRVRLESALTGAAGKNAARNG
jgi:signal transduction histidine kinase/CheY-like chemotaxis protein